MKNNCHKQKCKKGKKEKCSKKCEKMKDCPSCKKNVPEKSHKCSPNIENINTKSQQIYPQNNSNNYYSSSFWSNQIYGYEEEPYDALHIVQFIPFESLPNKEDAEKEYMNEYYTFISELYDCYCEFEREEKSKRKLKKKEKKKAKIIKEAEKKAEQKIEIGNKEEIKGIDEEQKFLEEFKKRLLNGKYYLHY